MRKVVLSLAIFAMVIVFALPAQAQATRTWVSGVGDDANPCSRTAPCKTFAGAISKTATGGEINVLDPGGFGGVTITKSITISAEGVEAGVLVSGTNAIVINATTTSSVVLRGLDIEGLGTGLAGIKVLGGLGALHVENCTINNFRGTNGSGIDIATTAAGTTQIHISNTIVRNSGAGTGGGIHIHPGASATVKGTLEHVELYNNLFGLKAQDRSFIGIKNSVAGNNANAGFSAQQVTGGTPIEMNLDQCLSESNGTDGVQSNGTSSVITRIANTTVTGNATALNVVGAAQLVSFGNNNVAGTTDLPTSTPGEI